LHGRIDLAQAEAVVDLIHARTELSLAAANEQLAGKLSRRIDQLRDDLMLTLAHVEAHLDFPDEDIAPTRAGNCWSASKTPSFSWTSCCERPMRDRFYGAGFGRPSSVVPTPGKSSLLNQLLGRDRAIVSPIPGTTRDTIEETANIRGIPVVFIDTAGLREAGDEIEAEGIRRSRNPWPPPN
jgi:tRNA modification GTPase